MVDHSGEKRANSSSYEKEFHCWTSLRAVFGMMIPCCGCQSTTSNSIGSSRPVFLMSSTVTGTIFGQRKGRVNFCVQEDPAGPPILLLEFAIPTHLLVKEMQSGLLRITLECEKKKDINEQEEIPPLFSEPVWSMYCNGRKVGFAMRKAAKSDSDSTIANLISLMQSVSTGAGVIPCKNYNHSIDSHGGNGAHNGSNANAQNGNGGSVGRSKEEDELIYMRATYERVVGSPDSEAFHMINPDVSQGQELSIFLTRS